MNAKRDPVSLVPLYNFIARHQSPARVTFGIKYQLHTVHQLTKLTSLVRGVIDPFSGTNFLFVPINTSRSGTGKGPSPFEATLTNVCRLLTKVERSLIDEIFTTLSACTASG